MIVCSAIKYNDKIYTGKRHCDCYREIWREFPDAEITNPDNEGFVDNQGRFLRRKAALHYAMKCGQIKKPKYQTNELFSEDLW